LFLAGLEEGVLSELAARAETLRVASDETIITRGETGSTMYFIISGRARVHDGEVTWAYIEEGEVFGEMAVLDSEVRSASITTESHDHQPLYRDHPRRSSMFASVFFGLLNPETGELTYINAVCEFRGEADQSDDITMLALKYLP